MTDQERLAAYDRLYADLLKERDQVLSRLEEQRAAGAAQPAAPAPAQEPEAEKAAVSDDDWDILERIFNRKR